MDEGIVRKLAQASERIGIVPEMIPSGAGHDSAVFANEGVPTGMVFVRNENGSHNPREAMDIDDFLKGVELLTTAITDGI
jgi:N-carbamoyl-L-amino-acid hydrolase